MCYKYMWDNLVANNFPSRQFFDFFSLNPYYVLSEEVREIMAEAGYPAKVQPYKLSFLFEHLAPFHPQDPGH